ncbi:hypothetical protein Tco_0719984 [Tanacetum coccineum]
MKAVRSSSHVSIVPSLSLSSHVFASPVSDRGNIIRRTTSFSVVTFNGKFICGLRNSDCGTGSLSDNTVGSPHGFIIHGIEIFNGNKKVTEVIDVENWRIDNSRVLRWIVSLIEGNSSVLSTKSSIHIHSDDDEQTESDNEDQADNAEKNDEDKAEEEKDTDQERIQDEQAKDEVAGVLVSMTHKGKPKLMIATSSQLVSSSYGNQFLVSSPERSLLGTIKESTDAEITSMVDVLIQQKIPPILSAPLLDVLASVVPLTPTNPTPPPIQTTIITTTTEAPSSTTAIPDSKTLSAL